MTLDEIELHPAGPVQIREITEAGLYHRRVILPGEDISSEVQAIRDACADHWTPERVAAWAAAQPE